ncbi:MAG TPA: VIT domain-containing protein [Polyangia bacterium]
MTRTRTLVPGVLVALALGLAGPGRAAREEAGPVVSNHGHMQVLTDGAGTAVLPLRHTAVRAQVVGVIAAVEVTQQFQNPFTRPIEAVYVFPLPHRAAIHALTMQVGARVITAEVKEREAARKTYERAKRQGRTASLLEQERPNVFTQSVANIMPGEEIRVSLRYVEELVPEEGEYQFEFPMVVGPRYMGGEAVPGRRGAGWSQGTTRVPDASRISPHLLPPGLRSGHDISLTLTINAGLPLRDLRAVTHATTLAQPAADTATVELDPADRIPNKDFVVRYRLTGERPRLSLLANRDARGGHFLLMLQPKSRLAAADVAPREYVFVVDTSGSMHGRPLEQVRQAMRLCLNSMNASDRFQIVNFDTRAVAFAPAPVEPSAANLRRALAFVDELQGGGGTEFLPALALALDAPRDPARARIVLFMSDGYIGYEREVLKFIGEHLGRANLFAFGVGSSVNRYLIDGMARAGHGEPAILLGRAGDDDLVRRFFRLVSQPALTEVSLDFGGLGVTDLTPARAPDLFADRPIVVAGRFARGGRGTVTLRGRLAGAPYEEQVAVTLPDVPASDASPALSYLWARRRIAELGDRHDRDEHYRPAAKALITELALRYNLMSEFTSFVAVDRVVRNRGGRAATVGVPVPLPDGVETTAAPPVAYARAELSTDRFVPGDPEVEISAPPDTHSVTLVFPTGELKPGRRDARTGRWVASFLIPEDTPDGIYAIKIVVTRFSGEQLVRTVRYQVDGTAPRVRIRLTPALAAPGAPVRIVVEPEGLAPAPARPEDDIGDPTFGARVTQDVKSAQALPPGGRALDLTRQPDGSFAATFRAPGRPGRYEVPVVVRDHARNKTREVLVLTVR